MARKFTHVAAHRYERDLSALCKDKHVTKVATVRGAGEQLVSGYTITLVPYLIFDVADGGERYKRASSFDIHAGWNVRLKLFYADDYAVFLLNGEKMLDISFGEAEKPDVDLQNALKQGENTLQVQGWNYQPPVWSFRYRIGIFDAQGKPAFDAIDLTSKGTTPHYGVQYDVMYTFNKT